jgi:hypothetical protein
VLTMTSRKSSVDVFSSANVKEHSMKRKLTAIRQMAFFTDVLFFIILKYITKIKLFQLLKRGKKKRR